jgi:hypothetical protein
VISSWTRRLDTGLCPYEDLAFRFLRLPDQVGIVPNGGIPGYKHLAPKENAAHLTRRRFYATVLEESRLDASTTWSIKNLLNGTEEFSLVFIIWDF